MDPVATLRHIAFLLERDLAPTYRVRAFRTAAEVIAALPATEVERRAEAGTLTALKGIGDTTAGVIEAAVRGETPAYLADLESAVAAPTSVGATLRAALRGDLHAHTTWSDGGSSIDEMADAATALGHEYLAITDHSPRLTVARGLTAERLVEQLGVIDEWNTRAGNGLRLLTGIECDILADGSLDQTDELLGMLDVVVASVHSDLRAESRTMTARMLAAVGNPHTDILGHCTGRLIVGARGKRPPSRFDADAVFAACAEHGVAVEINSRPERLDPPKVLLAKAVAAGCLFAIDTDAHAPGQLDWQSNGCARAELCGVPGDRVVNTWPLDRLRDWLTRPRIG
jgi:putative hydrolase